MLNLGYRLFFKISFFCTIRLTESRTTVPVNSPLILWPSLEQHQRAGVANLQNEHSKMPLRVNYIHVTHN